MGTWGSGAYTLTLGEYVPPVPVTGNDTCSDAFEITADGSWSGDTTGMTHTVDGSCGYGGARDAWFTFTLSSASHVILDTMDSALDTVLYVISGTCSGAELACDDMSGPGMTSRLELDLDPGTYYVVVDGYYHTYYDDYILTVSGL